MSNEGTKFRMIFNPRTTQKETCRATQIEI